MLYKQIKMKRFKKGGKYAQKRFCHVAALSLGASLDVGRFI